MDKIQAAHRSSPMSDLPVDHEQHMSPHGPSPDGPKQAPSSSSQAIQEESANSQYTDQDHRNPYSTQLSQADPQLLREHVAQEFVRNDSAAATGTLNYSPDVTASGETCQTASSSASANTQTANTVVLNNASPSPPYSEAISSIPKQDRLHPLPVSQSLGLEGCAGIFGGFLGILGIIGFFSFLWFGSGPAPEAASANWVWRELAIRNWMPRAITLTSIVLRFIIGIQATICTSMVAALVLERLAVPRSQAARASIMRAINDGPLKLVMLVFSYKNKLSYIIWSLETWLILVVALLSLALQFTSTILLSDMHSFIIVGDGNSTTVNSLFALTGDTYVMETNLLANSPVYPVIGETVTNYNSSPDSLGFSDTGLKQRGLLPMAKGDARASVREYEGMGIVMSSRVACMPPIIANASLELVLKSFGRLRGILNYGQSLEEARPGTGPLCNTSQKCRQLPFECVIPAAVNSTERWGTGGCMVNEVGGHMRGPKEPIWDPTTGPWSVNSSIWLAYSTNMGDTDWQSANPALPSDHPLVDSEWNIYEVTPGHYIKLSLCFSGISFAHQGILMNAPGTTAERFSPWSLFLKSDFNMTEVETYLGLNPSRQTIADRRILELQLKPDNNSTHARNSTNTPPVTEIAKLPANEVDPAAMTIDYLAYMVRWQFTNGFTGNATFTLCNHCTVMALTIHMDYSLLFSSILFGDLVGAGRAAEALHAFITVAGISIHDQFLANVMDVGEQVRLVTTTEVTVPGSWPPSAAKCAGFITVVSLLAIYVAAVTAITVLYVRCTRYSRHANVWHVISQLAVSEELGETLDLGNDEGDKAVAKGLRAHGSSKEDILVKLGRVEGCDKIAIRKQHT